MQYCENVFINVTTFSPNLIAVFRKLYFVSICVCVWVVKVNTSSRFCVPIRLKSQITLDISNLVCDNRKAHIGIVRDGWLRL